MSNTGEVEDGLGARREAGRLLQAALARRNGLEEAAASAGFKALSPRDRGFARALTLAALRWLGPIDQALDARLQRQPPEGVRTILRLGAAQLWALETPAWAAVDTGVRLAEADGATRKFKGLVNAVLRGLARDGKPQAPPEAFLPDWLWARWRAAYGEERARAVAAMIGQEPPTDLSAKGDPAAIAEALEGQVLPTGSVRTERRGDVSGWPGYPEGGWWVQEAAAALPTRLLDVQPGETALDLCAAPGGKTLQLAAAGAQVTALDRSAARLKRLEANLLRAQLSAEVVAADAVSWDDRRTFGAVLLDAPCTATGTFRRRPDVLWAARPGEVGQLAALQAQLLDSAARRVRTGGRLVYSTCSLEPEEGEAQVAAFLARSPGFERAPPAAGEAGAPEEALTAEGDLRLLPSMWAERGGLDGFYIARMVRRG
ncbi:MAG: rRNA methyltransferase [Proteobacteria bacterium]|nr:rRNA methyltransferase [Pseudomonadota bacterium]